MGNIWGRAYYAFSPSSLSLFLFTGSVFCPRLWLFALFYWKVFWICKAIRRISMKMLNSGSLASSRIKNTSQTSVPTLRHQLGSTLRPNTSILSLNIEENSKTEISMAFVDGIHETIQKPRSPWYLSMVAIDPIFNGLLWDMQIDLTLVISMKLSPIESTNRAHLICLRGGNCSLIMDSANLSCGGSQFFSFWSSDIYTRSRKPSSHSFKKLIYIENIIYITLQEI